MSRQMTVAIAGLGSRGRDTYAKAAKIYPDKMKIVAIADIDPEKVKLTAEEYDVPMSHCYESAEDMLKEEKLADAMIIATQDRQHVGQAIKALKKGYHLLLEKPISPDLGECRKISEVAKECKREVVVCHVLRYTPIYQKVKEILDAGTIGDVISIMAIENVGWFHQAHSFVRGNWANSDETSPMILQKCCHDMDLYLWLAEKTCRSLTSYGDLNYFTPEHAPEGCTGRCLEGCKAKEKCIFDAEKIYLEHERIGYRQGNRGWPLDVLVPSGPTEEKLIEALKTGPYGKCVFHCNNNVVDHQVVNLNMTDGTTMSFQLFFKVTIPLLTPTIFFVMITSIISGFQVFDVIYMMIGKTNPAYANTQTVVMLFYRQAFDYGYKGYAAAISILIFAVIMLVTVIQMIGQKKWVNYD